MIRLKRLYAHNFKQLHEIEIHFPEAGRTLVQGKNEAGKSTLFEAIFFAFFGQALATESSGKPNLDDLIGYEKSKARVELELAAHDRLFRITRTLNRGKANVWQLDIINDARTEEIRGNRAVNDRLVSELGFDAEALLNTCFVEQKKLEKLEGLNKSKREESLSKLLNLERLLDLEEKLRLRVEDERMLARLERRVELAETQEQLPTAEEDLTKAAEQLRLLELRAQVSRAAEEKRAAQDLRAQLQTMQAQHTELTSAVSQVEALDLARRSIKTALDRFDLLAQQKTNLGALVHERDETERAAHENLPALEQRARELGRLLRHLTRVNQVEAARGLAMSEWQRLQTAQQELDTHLARGNELNTTIATHEARANQLSTMLRDYDLGAALGEWATLAREGNIENDRRALDEKSRAHAQAESRLRAGLIAPGIILLALIAATIVIPSLLFVVADNAGMAIIVGGILLVADVALAIVLGRRGLELWRSLAQAAEALGQAQGEFATRREIAATVTERMNLAAARLQELGTTIPASWQTAHTRRIEIAATLENKTREELSAERDTVHEKLNYARAQRDEVVKRIQDLQVAMADGNAARYQRIVEKAARILGRWQPRLARRAAELQVAPEIQSVRDVQQQIESERKNWQMRIQQAVKLGAQIKEGEARVQKISGELQEAYDSAHGLLSEPTTSAWEINLPREGYIALGRKLMAAFQAHGGEQVRAQLNALEKELGATERESKLREKSAQDAISAARVILQELNITDQLSAQPALAELDELAARLHKVQFEDKTQLEARVKALQMRVGALRDTQARLERELGLQGEVVDLNAVREELDKERRDQTERKFAVEIVSRARKRIVQKILPATMDYMRRILPQLTRDRYHDAELDPETYKIKVWDERAGQSGAWKEKNIFSGGTKDQFSLALRLAFALATLPQERGTSPGFIFLDEPLGSFDDERAAALLYLLTDGEISRAFDQIFLISHVRVEENRFTHQMVLENGVIKESNLKAN